MQAWAGNITVGLGWVFYDGPVSHTAFHRHYAVQICFPSDGEFRVETEEKDQTVDTILVIGSNVSHRISSPRATAKLLYIEPNLIKRNTAQLSLRRAETLALRPEQLAALAEKLSDGPRPTEADFGFQLTALIWPEGSNEHFSPLDPRVSHALSMIAAAENLNLTLAEIVGCSGLSPSRFRHLFSAQLGMPLKSYLLWAKIQRAIQLLATDRSLTRAVHAAGFADSAHLSRTFRNTFGLAPADLNRQARFLAPKTLR